MLLLLPSGAAAAVDAGSLRAAVSQDPWGLSFVADDGRRVLSEHSGTGLGPTGTLGFRTAAGWFHATRVASSRNEGQAFVAELETNDPQGRRLEVRLAPDAEGVIALRARVLGSTNGLTALGMGFESPPGERHLGFGERSNAVDQRGNTVENYVSDGPFQFEERPFLQAFIPPWGFRERDDATYFPMPWLLSTRGYGVLVDNTETSYFRLGSDQPGAWSVEVTSAPPGEAGADPLQAPDHLALRVFAGPTPADVVRRLTAAVGRQPAPVAPWMLGAWFHTGQENQPDPQDERRYVRLLREGDAPVSVVETHLRYLPCGEAVPHRQQERARTAYLHSQGLATISYLNPEICTSYQPVYDQAAAQDVLTEDRNGEPYVYIAYVGSRTPPQTPISQVDFSAPGAQSFFDGLMSDPVEDGHDGWMEDFGEYTPLDSRSANGMDGTEMHNLYPVLYHRAGFDFVRRQGRPIVRHVRSGWTGVHPYAQIVWGGDPTTDWGYDGLASAVKQALSMGLSGVSTWGSDIGGFFSLGTRALTPELLQRWVQFGAVSGVMRTKKAGVAVPPKERPQVWEPGQLANWRRYAKLRTQLYPYIVAADATYRERGLPVMRHLALGYQDDPRATGREDEFMFGPDLLAAPVLQPGARRRTLYLPRGLWVDLWRSVSFVRESGGLRLGRARALAGGRDHTVPAPIEELPLMARAGALLPLLPPDVDTLSEYGSGAASRADREALVSLAERRDRMQLLAFPRGRSSARMGTGEQLESREEGGARWLLTVGGDRSRRYELQASMATLERPFTPCRLELDGRALEASDWSYDGATGALRASFETRSATLAVSGRCTRPARNRESEDRAPVDGDPPRQGRTADTGADDLPFTGFLVAFAALLGALLLAAGAALRRRGGRY